MIDGVVDWEILLLRLLAEAQEVGWGSEVVVFMDGTEWSSFRDMEALVVGAIGRQENLRQVYDLLNGLLNEEFCKHFFSFAGYSVTEEKNGGVADDAFRSVL